MRILASYSWSTPNYYQHQHVLLAVAFLCICCLHFLCVACLFASSVCDLFVLAAVFEFSVALFLHVFGPRRPGPGKMRKEDPEDDQNAKNKHAWKRPAGQNAKKSKPANRGRPKRKKESKKTGKKTVKKCKKSANAPGNGKFSRFLKISATTANFCIFFAFWPASVCRLAFPLHFGRPAASRRACFLRFGRPQDVGAPSFRILPGPGRLGPKTCTNTCDAKFTHGSKHKKTANSKCKQKCNKENANSKCKKMRNKCKTKFQTLP